MRRGRTGRTKRDSEVSKESLPVIRLILKKAGTAGLSRYGLSKIAGVDDRYLARLESGEARKPSREKLIKLALALVSYTSMFGRKDVDEILKVAGEPPSPEHLWMERIYVFTDGDSYFRRQLPPRWPPLNWD